MSLTKKQRRILDAIVYLMRQGEIPTVREVGALAGLSSPATVLKHLRALEGEGLITISGKSRGIRIADPDLLARVVRDGAAESPHRASDAAGRDSGEAGDPAFMPERATAPEGSSRHDILAAHLETISRAAGRGSGVRPRERTRVPVVGAIAAGRPVETQAEAFAPSAGEDRPCLAIDPQLFAASGELFALRVEGDSMVGAGILDGDYAIIRRQESVEDGDIAAVLVNGEATLKRWYHGVRCAPGSLRGDANVVSGQDAAAQEAADDFDRDPCEDPMQHETVRLVAANERFEPLEITELDRKEVLVVGKYVGLVRGAQML